MKWQNRSPQMTEVKKLGVVITPTFLKQSKNKVFSLNFLKNGRVGSFSILPCSTGSVDLNSETAFQPFLVDVCFDVVGRGCSK